jgi:hypothetical protein
MFCRLFQMALSVIADHVAGSDRRGALRIGPNFPGSHRDLSQGRNPEGFHFVVQFSAVVAKF